MAYIKDTRYLERFLVDLDLALDLFLSPVNKHIFLCHTFLAPCCSAQEHGSKPPSTSYPENVLQNKDFLYGLKRHFVIAIESPINMLIYQNLKILEVFKQ